MGSTATAHRFCPTFNVIEWRSAAAANESTRNGRIAKRPGGLQFGQRYLYQYVVGFLLSHGPESVSTDIKQRREDTADEQDLSYHPDWGYLPLNGDTTIDPGTLHRRIRPLISLHLQYVALRRTYG
jgi:hypothetical protein